MSLLQEHILLSHTFTLNVTGESRLTELVHSIKFGSVYAKDYIEVSFVETEENFEYLNRLHGSYQHHTLIQNNAKGEELFKRVDNRLGRWAESHTVLDYGSNAISLRVVRVELK